MNPALSDAYGIDVVDAIRQLTAGITDTPTLTSDRWDALVRRAADADSEIAKVVARVDRRTSLLGLARRFAGEAARADQSPALREIVDRLVAGNGRSPTNEDIDRAVDEAAAWSYKARQRAQVVRVAVDQLPSRLGISDRRWACHDGAAKHPDTTAMVPPDAFGEWCRHAAAAGDVCALVQSSFADGIALDFGKYSGEIVPVPTNNPASNSVRCMTWLLPVRERDSRSRAALLIRSPQSRDAIAACPPVAATLTQIASGSALLYA